MTSTVLLCQGFQRAFIDPASATFSHSASLRRATCEQILKRARASGWMTVHAFLDTADLGATGAASIDGFAPGRVEPYFHQRTLSAFEAPGFDQKLASLHGDPIFLISFAGVGAIAATFLDGMERRLPLYIVGDAIADVPSAGVSEDSKLGAMATIARAYGRHVTSKDLAWIDDLPSSAFQFVSIEKQT